MLIQWTQRSAGVPLYGVPAPAGIASPAGFGLFPVNPTPGTASTVQIVSIAGDGPASYSGVIIV